MDENINPEKLVKELISIQAGLEIDEVEPFLDLREDLSLGPGELAEIQIKLEKMGVKVDFTKINSVHDLIDTVEQEVELL